MVGDLVRVFAIIEAALHGVGIVRIEKTGE